MTPCTRSARNTIPTISLCRSLHFDYPMSETTHRILVPVRTKEQFQQLSPLLVPLAKKRQSHIILLYIVRPYLGKDWDSKAVEKWLNEIVQSLHDQDVEAEWQQKQGHNLGGMIREAVEAWEPDWLILNWQRRHDRDPFPYDLQDLLLDVPCTLLVWRGIAGDNPLPRHILLPSAGGPNASWAVKLARDVAAAYEGTLTLLAVQDVKADDASFSGIHHRLRALASEGKEEESQPAKDVKISIARAASPTAGILEEAHSGDYDLLVIGATREGLWTRLLFGEVPDRVTRKADIPVLLIKRPLPKAVSAARRVVDTVNKVTPTLSEAEKVEVYRNVRSSARTDADFVTMISLSGLIAALGLLLSSPAVVIGAMLVAPLMSAVIALGLAVVQGDKRLLRIAGHTVLMGIGLAMGISLLVGLLAPGKLLTAEMLARSSPTLLDLIVALASGAAGAYALCRQDVSTSLPGVAIAVALVPPLATIGLSLSQGDWRIAGGAMLLFATNLIAIAAMGSVVFLMLGFQPEGRNPARLRIFARGWWTMFLLLAVVGGMLTVLSWQSAREAARTQTIERTVVQEVEKLDGIDVRDVSWQEDADGILQIEIEVGASRTLQYAEVQDLQDELASSLQQPVGLIFQVIPTTRLDARATPTPEVTSPD